MTDAIETDSARARALRDIANSGRELSTAMVLFHGRLSAAVGLGPTEEKVLELILRGQATTVVELAEQTGMAKNSISDLLDRLERKGFVVRSPHPTDGRKLALVATESGLQRIRGHFAGLLSELDGLYAGYSTEQLALIAEFQSRVAAIQLREAKKLGD